jgi:hypothetical protein
MLDHARPRGRRRSSPSAGQRGIARVLLACGIAYGIAYIVANDVVAAGMWEHYSPVDQAISELSGTRAPSAAFLAAMNPVFAVLVVAFGVGVRLTSDGSRALRATGVLLVVQGLSFPVWLLYPMTSREDLAQGVSGANDVGHLVLSAVAVACMVAEMILSGVALGTPFRYFAVATAVLLLAAGTYVAMTPTTLAAGGDTPWMGLIERLSYGAWLVWMAGLTGSLLSRSRRSTPCNLPVAFPQTSGT